MRVTFFRSVMSTVGGTALVVGALLLTPHAAAAQYRAQVLPVPDGMPAGAETTAYGINSNEQVLGSVRPSLYDRRPVLWTNGVPQLLQVPDGYYWAENEGYPHLNERGTAVGRVLAQNPPQGVPYSSSVVVWQNGVAQIMPPPPGATPSCNYDDYYPVGLNNNGHLLFWTANLQSGVHCTRIWLWDGIGSSASDFQELSTEPCFSFWFAFGNYTNPDTHLNDADHISVNLGTMDAGGTCSFSAGIAAYGGRTIGLLASGSAFTPLTPWVGTSYDGAHGINNHDQVLVSISGELHLWDGMTLADLVNLGAVGDGFLNDRGQVLFHVDPNRYTRTPRIYADGAVNDVPLPQDLPGCSFDPGVGTSQASALGLNSAGQIALQMVLNCGPSGTVYTYPGRVVVLTREGSGPTPLVNVPVRRSQPRAR